VLRNKILLIDSAAVLCAAVIHFLAVELPGDSFLATAAVTVLNVPITFALLLAWMLTAALLICPAVLRAGRIIFSDRQDRSVAIAMTLAAAALFMRRTAADLPLIGATWSWLLLAAGLSAVALWRRSRWLAPTAMVLLGAAALKWALGDTLLNFLQEAGKSTRLVVANWQFLAGLGLAGAILGFQKLMAGRELCRHRGLTVPLFLLGSLLAGWGGSFEVHRFFHSGRAAGWADPYQGTQMGLSLWWGLYAAGMLTVGFIRSRPSLRYVAMALFAATIVKVSFVDLAHIKMVYRVLSLIGLGLLLLAGSWLYHRQMRARS